MIELPQDGDTEGCVLDTQLLSSNPSCPNPCLLRNSRHIYLNVVFLIVKIIRCLLRLLFNLLHACLVSRKDRQSLILYSGAIFFAYLLSPPSLTILIPQRHFHQLQQVFVAQLLGHFSKVRGADFTIPQQIRSSFKCIH